MKHKTIELRAHTERIEKSINGKITYSQVFEKWPKRALIVDCETTLDHRQCLTFGCYRYCRQGKNGYKSLQEGLFHADDLDSAQIAILLRYGKTHGVQILSRSQFIKRIFWQAIRAEALIVGFNLPFDLSRLALESCWTTRRGGAWSLTMNQYLDRATGKMRENKFRPRITVKPKDGKGSFFRLVNCRNQRRTAFPPIRCLDLKTLFWALYNKSHTLDSACRDRGIPGKIGDHKPTGKVTVKEIEYNRQDGIATEGLLNKLKTEFDRHSIALTPYRAFSPASVAKSYLKEMGLSLPSEKFQLSPKMHGIAMQAYYGGRVECRIRRTPVPAVYMDFMSEYPTVNTLMGLWRFLIADRLGIETATNKVREFLKRVALERAFDPHFWKQLTFFVLLEPSEDILPIRTAYNERNSNIGVNPLTSKTPVWYTGPDIVASVLLTGKIPKIVKAVCVSPNGNQAGLTPTLLRGAVSVDPSTDDFFQKVIESRLQIKSDKQLPENERKALVYFLKILANAGSYGLFVELNPERIRSKSKKNREKIRVFSGDKVFQTSSEIVETPGPWYCPIFASLIPSAGRLLLAMLERCITDANGSYVICDTDSMAVVASENGGLVSCVGGTSRLPDGREAIKALSWAEVQRISDKFSELNPYNCNGVTRKMSDSSNSILKIEDVNFDSQGKQRELFCYSISSKRYALFTKTANGIQIEKASGHGLGYLHSPKPGIDEKKDAPVWIVEAWDWIIRNALNLPCSDPKWFDLPAMMRIVIRTPEVLKALQALQNGLPYRDRTKCFNFISSPVIDKLRGYPVGVDPSRFFLVAPVPPNSKDWRKIDWVNIYDGKSYRLGDPRDDLLSNQVLADTYGNILGQYTKQAEAKSLSPNGNVCTRKTEGLLKRIPVIAAEEFRIIGKETDRRWEEEDDISLFNSRVTEYRPGETKHIVNDPILRTKTYEDGLSKNKIAQAAGVDRKTVNRLRAGKRIRKSTALKIYRAIEKIRQEGSKT